MANPTIVFMFSGQGSHYYQMGRELFKQEPTFRKLLLDLDAIVRDMVGLSVVRSLYDDTRAKYDLFERVLLTNPAIFMVEFAMAQTLIERNITPDYALGVSMGSFAAAVIAGCIGPEEALTAVIKQADTIEKHCRRGGMIAILSDPRVYQDQALSSNCDIAAINFSSHFVVAARQDRLDIIESYLRDNHITFQRLPVSYAFHSRWIDEARDPFQAFLRRLSYKPARIPLVCCAGAAILTAIPDDYFWTTAREPIRFRDTIVNLESRGTYRYIDVGPSGSLATSVKYAVAPTSASEALSTLNPYGHEINAKLLTLATYRASH
jgi:acyl transferase domain-containing protein